MGFQNIDSKPLLSTFNIDFWATFGRASFGTLAQNLLRPRVFDNVNKNNIKSWNFLKLRFWYQRLPKLTKWIFEKFVWGLKGVSETKICHKEPKMGSKIERENLCRLLSLLLWDARVRKELIHKSKMYCFSRHLTEILYRNVLLPVLMNLSLINVKKHEKITKIEN